MAGKYPAIWAIGMMSGTSLDGVDAALIRTNGLEVLESGPFVSIPFSDELYNDLYEAVHLRGDMPRIERDFTKMHADVVKKLLTEAGMKAKEIGIIGFHGQTVSHRPKEGITWQIGNGAMLAGLADIDVVCDFRRRDVSAGGEGAPLVPLFHASLVRNMALPVAVLNIGGVANVTWVGRSEDHSESLMEMDIMAFDTGPGNALINDWVRSKTGKAYDDGGALALAGQVQEAVLADYMALPYFTAYPPKSLDRNQFKDDAPLQNLSVEQGAATLTAFTVQSIIDGVKFFPAPPKRWLVTGGGRHNAAIMQGLSRQLMNVQPVEAVGWNGDALEAQAFAFLAVRSLYNLPLSLPTTTGASRAVTGGAYYRSGYFG